MEQPSIFEASFSEIWDFRLLQCLQSEDVDPSRWRDQILIFWHYWNFLLGSSFNPLTLLRKSLPRIVRCHAWRRLSRTDLLYDFCLCDPAIVFLFVRFVGTCYDGQCMQEHSSLLQSHQWKVKEELSYSFFYNWNLFGSALFLLCMAPVVNYMLLLAPAAHIVRMFAEISSMVWYHSAPMTTDNLLTLCIPLQHVEKGAFDCCPFPAVKCSFFYMLLTGLAWTWL